MCQREDAGRGEDGRGLTRQQPQQPQQEIALQQKLLHDGPHDVTPSMQVNGRRSVQAVQRVGSPGEEDHTRREHESNSKDP